MTEVVLESCPSKYCICYLLYKKFVLLEYVSRQYQYPNTLVIWEYRTSQLRNITRRRSEGGVVVGC